MHNNKKFVLITGGTGEIGSEIARIFREKQYNVSAIGRMDMDLSNPLSIKNYMEKNTTEWSIIIHCAAQNTPRSVDKMNMVDIRQSMEVNLLSFFEILTYCLPRVKRAYGQKRILAISSIYGSSGRANRLVYSTTKHALSGAVKTLGIELAKYNTLVNSLSPGYVSTSLTYNNNSPEDIEEIKKDIPLGRLADATEIAQVAYFLCSEHNTYINGQDIIVDGGFLAGGYQS